jgi:hypothetical protein
MKKEIKFYVSTVALLITFSVTSNVSLGSYSYSTHTITNRNNLDKFDSCLGFQYALGLAKAALQVVRDPQMTSDDNVFAKKIDNIDRSDFSEFDCKK